MEDNVCERPDEGPDSKDESERKTEDRKKQTSVPASPRKVGESRDTLRRREEWFRKRQGQS